MSFGFKNSNGSGPKLSADDTLKMRMGESDGVPIEITDNERTWPNPPLVTQPVQYDEQIVEVIDQSDGVPLLLPGMADDTEPSIPTTRVRGKARLSN